MCKYANWGIEKMNWIINKLFIGHWYIICIGILFSAANWHIATLANYSVQRIRIECKQLRRQVTLSRIGQ